MKAYDETKFLDAAVRLFWETGYEGVSMGRVVAATGVNRGSIYAAYEGKDALFRAALDRYDETRRRAFLARLATGLPPRAAILAAFAAAAGIDAPQGDPAGCLLVNSAVERAPHDPEVAARVAESFAGVERFFRDMAALAAPERDAEALAVALLALFLGLRVLARSGAAPELRRSIIARAEAMLCG